jgi:hypothetical protein
MSSIPDRTPPVLHLRGTVVIDDPREVGEAWVVGGRITLTRAAGAADAVLPRAGCCRDSGVLLVRDAGSPADTGWVHDRTDLSRLIGAGHHLARPRRYLRPLWPDDVLAEAVAAAGVPVTATLLQVGQLEAITASAGRCPRFADRMRRLHTRRYGHVRDMDDAGIPVLVGTDAGGALPHGTRSGRPSGRRGAVSARSLAECFSVLGAAGPSIRLSSRPSGHAGPLPPRAGSVRPPQQKPGETTLWPPRFV